MKAAYYEQFQKAITIKQVPDPKPKPHGVVIRVEATGLCRSDWHGWMGHDADILLPHVPGHELAGTILETGKEVKVFQPGQRVTVPFVCGCGTCHECKSGNHQVCDYQSQPGFTHWGSFAEYVAIDYADTNLISLPESVSSITAATLGCRFITAFRAVVDQGKVTGGQHVVVHGCGGVGLSAVMIARAIGAQVTAVDINPDNLELARKLGANQTIHALNSHDVIEQVRAVTNGGAHVSVDALGHPKTCYHSITNLRKRGKHIQVGLMPEDPVIPMGLVIANELEILGSHGMQAFRYTDMLEMIGRGTLQPQLLVEQTVSLNEVPNLLPAMDRFTHKGVIVIDRFT